MPLFGSGLLLTIWVVASLGMTGWLLWRQGLNGDTWTYIGLFALVAVVIGRVLPAVAKPQGLPIRSYGVMMLVAVVLSTGLGMWRARRRGLDPDLVLSALFWLLVPGILGARVFYVIEYWTDQFWPAYNQGGLGALLGGVINIAEGGLVVYGSIIGGTIGLVVFARRSRIPLLPLCDLFAPCLMLGLALGRIGCLLNGCCYGGLCDAPWAVTFPRAEAPAYSPPYRAQVERGVMYGFSIPGDPDREPVVLWVKPNSPAAAAGLARGDRIVAVEEYPLKGKAGVAHWVFGEVFEARKDLDIEVAGRGLITIPAVEIPGRSLSVHPTQIYSSINALLLCLLLLAYDPFARRDGELLALLMTVYPVTRFLLEIIRTDESALFGTGLSISQNVSLLLLVGAAGLWFFIYRRKSSSAI